LQTAGVGVATSSSQVQIEIVETGDLHKGQNRDDHYNHPDDGFERFGDGDNIKDFPDTPDQYSHDDDGYE